MLTLCKLLVVQVYLCDKVDLGVPEVRRCVSATICSWESFLPEPESCGTWEQSFMWKESLCHVEVFGD